MSEFQKPGRIGLCLCFRCYVKSPCCVVFSLPGLGCTKITPLSVFTALLQGSPAIQLPRPQVRDTLLQGPPLPTRLTDRGRLSRSPTVSPGCPLQISSRSEWLLTAPTHRVQPHPQRPHIPWEAGPPSQRLVLLVLSAIFFPSGSVILVHRI